MNLTTRTNMTSIIEVALEQKLDSGMRDKNQIIAMIVDELGVPRPTVRRIARDLRNKYLDRVKILQSEVHTNLEKSL